MRTIYPSGVRSDLYDRNPLRVPFGFRYINQAPHSSRTDTSYTVPANRAAIFNGVVTSMLREVVATAAGQYNIQVQVYLGGSARQVIYNWSISNVALDEAIREYMGTIYLNEGDQIVVTSTDLSTGGGITYLIFGSILEYDK